MPNKLINRLADVLKFLPSPEWRRAFSKCLWLWIFPFYRPFWTDCCCNSQRSAASTHKKHAKSAGCVSGRIVRIGQFCNNRDQVIRKFFFVCVWLFHSHKSCDIILFWALYESICNLQASRHVQTQQLSDMCSLHINNISLRLEMEIKWTNNGWNVKTSLVVFFFFAYGKDKEKKNVVTSFSSNYIPAWTPFRECELAHLGRRKSYGWSRRSGGKGKDSRISSSAQIISLSFLQPND